MPTSVVLPSAPTTITGAEFLKLVGPKAGPVLGHHVLAVFSLAREYQHQRPIGTGTLLRIADRVFLVTAAHVANAVDQSLGDALVIGLPNDGHLHIIGGEILVTRTDYEDIAVVALDAASIAKVRNLPTLSLGQTWLSDDAPEAIYLLSGYPQEWHRQDRAAGKLVVGPYGLAVGLYRGDSGSFKGYEPRDHLLFTYGLNSLRDDPNWVRSPASIEGLSGSPVWRLANLPDGAQNWTPEAMKVVAIQTGTYRVKERMIVKTTRWPVLIAMLRSAFPDLIKPIDLHRP